MNRFIKLTAKAICCPSGSCENDGKNYDPIRGNVQICQAVSFEREAIGASRIILEHCAKIAESVASETSDGEGELYIARKIAEKIRALAPLA